MKRLIIIFAFIIVGIFEFGNAYAVDVSTICNGVAPTQGFNKFLAIKNKLATFPSALSPQEDGTYVLCFSDAVPINANSELQIIGHEDKPLIIYGLNLSASSSLAGPLLNLSGANITLQNISITGNGTLIDIIDGASDIAFQGTNNFTTTGSGPVIRIPADYGVFELTNSKLTGAGLGAAIEVPSGVDAIIQKNTISNFAEGIRISNDGSILLSDNLFESIGSFSPELGHHSA